MNRIEQTMQESFLDPEQNISSLFKASVSLNPYAPAIAAADQTLSYLELDARVSYILKRILRVGLENQSRVALCFDHDADAIAAILATLRGGFIYVPLEPQWPEERLGYICHDCSPSVLLTKSHHLHRLQRFVPPSISVIAIDDEVLEQIPEADPDEEKACHSSRQDLAYILYTSGSTGKPKGVVQNHDNVLRHIHNYTSSIQMVSSDRVSLLSTYAFDAAVMDIFGALLSGATLCVFDPRRGAVLGLSSFIQCRGVTIYHSTPTTFRSFLSITPPIGAHRSVRRVVLGGEASFQSDLELFQRHFQGAAVLVNGYGPTECTLAMQSFFTLKSRVEEPTLSLGSPVSGVTVTLLSKGTEEEAEICLRALQVAKGYWNNVDLTTQSFTLEDCESTVRNYRTGDLGRKLEDGTIQFVGRRDGRFKIRGHAVEPAEVEGALSRYPELSQVVAVSLRNESGTDSIAALVVAKEGASIAEEDLRKHLRECLPEYMLPAKYIFTDSLPLTSTGKVDRAACQALCVERIVDRCDHQVSIENESLRALWCKSLGSEEISDLDNFFSLGGDSLAAVRLFTKIVTVFKTQLSYGALFQDPTLASMSHALTMESQGGGPIPSTLSISPKSHELSESQRRYWLRSQKFSGPSSAFNLSFAYRFHHALNPELVEQAIRLLVARHDALRLRVSMKEETITTVASDLCSAFAPVRHLNVATAEFDNSDVNRILQEDASEPFALAGESLVRFTQFHVADKVQMFQMTAHHLVMDGWSRRILDREFASQIARSVTGINLEQIPVQVDYRNFIEYQRDYFPSTSLFQSEREFWKQTLDNGRFERLALPYSATPRASSSQRSQSVSLTLDATLSEEVRTLSQAHDTTIFTTFLAAVCITLHSLTKQNDMVITTDVAKRNDPRWSDVVGLFSDVLVIRCQLDPTSLFHLYLRKLSLAVRAAVNNQELAFGTVLEDTASCTLQNYQEAFPLAFFYEPFDVVPDTNIAEVQEIPSGDISRDLIVSVRDLGQKFEIVVLYRSDAFSHESMTDFVSRCAAIVKSLVSTWNVTIDEVLSRAV